MVKRGRSLVFHRAIIAISGVFLVLDGALSLIFGNARMYSCFNNSDIGNAVRVLRLGLGAFLIFIFLFLHNWID